MKLPVRVMESLVYITLYMQRSMESCRRNDNALRSWQSRCGIGRPTSIMTAILARYACRRPLTMVQAAITLPRSS